MDFKEKNNTDEFERLSMRLLNRQKIMMNNYKKSHITNENFIINNIFTNDQDVNDQIYNLIENPYQKKINLIYMILNSDLIIPFNNITDVIKFFNWLSPLNIEHNMSSKNWNQKIIKYGNKKKILLQNSIAKSDIDKHFNNTYIGVVKKVLTKSKVSYNYFEFKSKRFNKIKDIVWAFDFF